MPPPQRVDSRSRSRSRHQLPSTDRRPFDPVGHSERWSQGGAVLVVIMVGHLVRGGLEYSGPHRQPRPCTTIVHAPQLRRLAFRSRSASTRGSGCAQPGLARIALSCPNALQPTASNRLVDTWLIWSSRSTISARDAVLAKLLRAT